MGKGKSKGQTPKLAAQLFPLLTKQAAALGNYVQILGRDWNGCPEADKTGVRTCTRTRTRTCGALRPRDHQNTPPTCTLHHICKRGLVYKTLQSVYGGC